MRFPKLAPQAMFASAQDAHIGIGQSSINKLLDFPILMKDWLFGIKMILQTSFL